MNFLLVGYQYSGGATSVDIPVKFTVSSLSLVCYCVFLGRGFVVLLVPPLDLVGGYFPPLELMGFLQPPSELVGSIVPPSEIDFLDVVIESLVVALQI